MSSNKFHKIVFLAVAFVFATGCSVYSRPEKLEDYLHYIEYEKYDFDKLSKTANRLLDGKKKMPSAACSAVRRDSLFGRNFDWLYDNMGSCAKVRGSCQFPANQISPANAINWRKGGIFPA